MAVHDTHFIEEFGEVLKTKCHQNEPPFCEVACPFHLPILEMEDKWLHGRFNAVYRNYQNAVAFPAIVCRICSRPCEASCVLRNRGGSIAMGAIEEATVRLAKRRRPNAFNLPPKDKKIAIIGGGLAGLGCALRLCNKKYSVDIFEKNGYLGGNARSQMDEEIFDGEIVNQFREEHPGVYLNTEVRWDEEIPGNGSESLESMSREFIDLKIAENYQRDIAVQEIPGKTEDYDRENMVKDSSEDCLDIIRFSHLRENYDAIWIATGCGGNTFGRMLSGNGAFASDEEGIFLGGEAAGAKDPVYALAEGLRASLAIERYLKTSLMNEPTDEKKTRLIIDEERIPVTPRVEAKNPAEGYDAAEVAEEIRRCRKCSCDICMKECDLMRIHEKTPNRLYEEAYITVRPSTLANDGRWATRRIASCDQCGLCKNVCPQDIDMGQFLMQSHRGLKDTNAMPWAFHDYWLRDMEFSIQEAGFVLRQKGVETSPYVFFPGCQFAASDPMLAGEVVDWLLEKQPDAAIWSDCCGAPAVWAAEDEWQEEHVKRLREIWTSLGKPVMLLACPTCRKMMDRYLPEIPKMFLEEALLAWGLPRQRDSREDALFAWGLPMDEEIREEALFTWGLTGLDESKYNVTFAIFDPCAGRDYPQLATAVRSLARERGICYEELPYHGKMARCCSFGGQYSIASPDYAMRVKMERAEESPLPYITSCMNCRDAFASRGKENLHIIELVFGHRNRKREVPTITGRRENRLEWKARMLELFEQPAMEVREAAVRMICSVELEKKLSSQHILLSDMEEVIEFCEKEMRGVCHEDGSITGHKKIGHMTYWAVYLPREDGSFELKNGYAHRMNLEGE